MALSDLCEVQGNNFRLEFSGLLLLWFRRFFVLLDVKLAEQHDGIFTEDVGVRRVRLVHVGTVVC